ncbi:macro domain-containing protein [Streptomyces sp. NPDC051286]|uniref:macro domain-containing protein n=1 Tax=Streptomyces sp. NPDC051286 TaxID=3365647 RepID=UPI0037ABDA10
MTRPSRVRQRHDAKITTVEIEDESGKKVPHLATLENPGSQTQLRASDKSGAVQFASSTERSSRLVHTVGPVWSSAEDRSALLASCYREAMRVAAELGAGTVAFPTISTGIYGWPLDDGARIAVRTVLAEAGAPVEEVRFALFDAHAYTEFEQALAAEG